MTDASGGSKQDPEEGPKGFSRYPQYPQGGHRHSGQQPGVIPLRPLALGEIMDGAVTTLRKYARVVFTASAVVAVISALFYLAADVWILDHRDAVAIDTSASQEEQLNQALAVLGDGLKESAVIAVITLLTQTFLTGYLMIVVGKAVLGQSITFGQIWEDLKPRMLPLLGLTLLVTVIVGIGIVLLVIPGIWAYVVLSLATPALILERAAVGQAMRRSALLVQGAWWRVFGVLIVALLATFVIGFVIQIPFGMLTSNPVGTVPSTGDLLLRELGNAIAQTITVPFAAAVTALLYIDQRMRREGLDNELTKAAG
ncbi:YciC family protein [Saccharomonospora sp. NPDC006951]